MSKREGRAIPTETFQPSSANSKRLKPLRKKRGERTRVINTALDFYYSHLDGKHLSGGATA